MDHGELDRVAAGVDPLGAPAEAWELVLAAGFAVEEARRRVFDRNGLRHDDAAAANKVGPASGP